MSDPTETGTLSLLDEVALCALASGLPTSRVAELASFARERKQPLVWTMVERGRADETSLLKSLAEHLGLPFTDQEAVNGVEPPKFSPALAIRHQVMPLEEVNGRLKVACSDPFNWEQWDELSHFLSKPLDRVLCPRPIISRMLKSRYGIGADTVERLLANRPGKKGEQLVNKSGTNLSEEEQANEPTVVNLVNQILTEAIRANATDVHFEPYESRYRVRYRVDGMLEDISLPISVKLLKLALISRIKIMSNLDITEKRLPQDGRCHVSLAGQDYDLRVSILPGVYGEAVNIRLQSRQMVRMELESLGYDDQEREKITRLIQRPHGLILVTGPTGSGKTTTLYTCLSKINNATTKIITIEDPVEYWLENLLQMQVHEEIGFTFARALRSMLRHDPDVMLIGEIRDRETADIAIRSSLTGHLVFATLHTNDAASAFTRLLDIGIEPFLVASSVLGVLAQRLIRKVCPNCRKESPASALSPYELQQLGIDAAPDEIFWEGQRCEQCRFSGYRGRTAIAEMLVVNSEIRRLVQERQPAERIKDAACRDGMRTLREAALRALRAGKTTVSEVFRVTQDDA